MGFQKLTHLVRFSGIKIQAGQQKNRDEEITFSDKITFLQCFLHLLNSFFVKPELPQDDGSVIQKSGVIGNPSTLLSQRHGSCNLLIGGSVIFL